MLLAFLPITLVWFAVWPIKLTLPLFHISDVVSFVVLAIWPREFSIPVDLIILPASNIYSLIASYESAMPILRIIFPCSFVITPIVPELLSFSMFDPCSPVTLIWKPFFICFFTIAMWFSVEKTSNILGTIWPYLCSLTMLHGDAVYHFDFAIVFYIIWQIVDMNLWHILMGCWLASLWFVAELLLFVHTSEWSWLACFHLEWCFRGNFIPGVGGTAGIAAHL